MRKPQNDAARYVAKVSTRRSLYRYLVLLTLILSLSIWAWLKLHDPNTFPLHNIKVTGDLSHIDQNKVRQTLLPLVHEGFFGVDIPLIQHRIEQLAWVDSVDVARQWPDGLVLTIHEQQPVAYYGTRNLLTAKGELFAQEQEAIHSDLPHLTGPSGQHERMLQMLNVMNNALKALDLHVVHLQLSPRRAWVVDLSNGTQLVLGRVDIMQRFKHYISAYPKLMAQSQRQQQHMTAIYVDLRYSNGMAVHWQKRDT